MIEYNPTVTNWWVGFFSVAIACVKFCFADKNCCFGGTIISAFTNLIQDFYYCAFSDRFSSDHQWQPNQETEFWDAQFPTPKIRTGNHVFDYRKNYECILNLVVQEKRLFWIFFVVLVIFALHHSLATHIFQKLFWGWILTRIETHSDETKPEKPWMLKTVWQELKKMMMPISHKDCQPRFPTKL